MATSKMKSKASTSVQAVGRAKTAKLATSAKTAAPKVVAMKAKAKTLGSKPAVSSPVKLVAKHAGAISASADQRAGGGSEGEGQALVPASGSGSSGGIVARSQPRILITGATGFLGSHLVRLLATRTDPRRIRTLQTSAPAWLERLGVETMRGSVTSSDDVTRALAGVDEVYHLAGMVSMMEDDAHKMFALHVDGTRVLGQAAAAAGVRRVVMASTSGTLAVSKHPDASLDETCSPPLEIISRWPYYASKAYQEETARRALGDKVELVMVNPSLLLGPGDDRLSSTRVVLQFLAREILLTPTGGLSFVDVRDVAAALPVAMAKGRPGERYLLGAANWTFEELFGRLSRMSKVAGPVMKGRGQWPLWLARAQSSLYKHWGKTAPVAPDSVEMASYFWYFDSRKAEEELGFVPRDPTDTLFDTITYVREHFLDGFKGAVAKEPPGTTPADLADEAAFERSLPS